VNRTLRERATILSLSERMHYFARSVRAAGWEVFQRGKRPEEQTMFHEARQWESSPEPIDSRTSGSGAGC
jgi:hypothetical protein